MTGNHGSVAVGSVCVRHVINCVRPYEVGAAYVRRGSTKRQFCVAGWAPEVQSGLMVYAESARLVLCHPRPDDLVPLTATWTDPAVARHMGDFGPRDRQAVRTWLGEVSQAPEPQEGDRPGSVQFTLVRQDTGDAVGWLGLGKSSEAVAQWDFGYAVHPDHRGHGLAGEALAAAIDMCRSMFGVATFWGECDADNPASAHTMLTAGLTEIPAGTDGSRRFSTPAISAIPPASAGERANEGVA